MTFAIVDRPPVTERRKRFGMYQKMIEALSSLPPGKAISVPAIEAGMEARFRSSMNTAAIRAGLSVSISKGDGIYYVFRRTVAAV